MGDGAVPFVSFVLDWSRERGFFSRVVIEFPRRWKLYGRSLVCFSKVVGWEHDVLIYGLSIGRAETWEKVGSNALLE